MRKILLLLGISCTLFSCSNKPGAGDGESRHKNDAFNKMLDNYWEERMQLFPLEATANGDYRYNDRMTITIAESFRDSLAKFYRKYADELKKTDTAALDATDKISYRLFAYEMQMDLEGLKYPTHLMPINQFWSPTLDMPQLASGQGNQPFKTVKDYHDFLKRLSVFPAWTDTAIANMRKGIQQGWVLPQTLVVKILPQLKPMLGSDPKESIFYGSVILMPDSIKKTDSAALSEAYIKAIETEVKPSYQKLYDFFSKEYMAAARKTSGTGALPGGKEYYDYCIRYWTTTSMSPDSIYNTGLHEVQRLEAEMNKVKDETGFKGDLKAFFEYLNKDKQFFPFTTPKQVLDSFWAIKKQEDPQLQKMFLHTPKSPFTIRQTEAFRAASASAEYNPGSADGSRPGIFYVPILDATRFNAVGMETLFLHEAIPGHHYQISIQQESQDLPQFRRFLWYGAYGEGWALYSETLGKELGLYKNPYQYFGHLSDAIHRAIRLVVDIGIHAKGMTREEAVAYMTAHERITTEEATTEIERYMAIPGQALSYKTGQMSISAERKKYEDMLGSKFSIASFHDEVLKNGCLPLQVLQEQLAKWAAKQK
ncbi:DUF885 domain-containing protein [Chitinophagaceae bacterium MMS25-I14]